MFVRRRWKIGIAVLALVAIAAAVALTTGDPGPKYNGRTLSDWISDYEAATEANPGNGGPAAQVLRDDIGTNALPTLIKWIRYEKSPAVAQVEALIEPIADKIGAARKYELLTHRGENRAWLALAVLDLLGTNATPAIPQLSNMVLNPKLSAASVNALTALASIGTAGTQTIIALLNNPDNPHRLASLNSLERCSHIDRDVIKEEVRKHLDDPDAKIRRAATNVFMNIRGALPAPQF